MPKSAFKFKCVCVFPSHCTLELVLSNSDSVCDVFSHWMVCLWRSNKSWRNLTKHKDVFISKEKLFQTLHILAVNAASRLNWLPSPSNYAQQLSFNTSSGRKTLCCENILYLHNLCPLDLSGNDSDLTHFAFGLSIYFFCFIIGFFLDSSFF